MLNKPITAIQAINLVAAFVCVFFLALGVALDGVTGFTAFWVITLAFNIFAFVINSKRNDTSSV